jgi:hypothetical protein
MSSHTVAEQSPFRCGDHCLWYVTLTCTCRRRFAARGKTEESALKKAETEFRAHIPIREEE